MAQVCSSCRHLSADGAKFCQECGAPFARRCPSCGTPASTGKFCAECGGALAADPSPAPRPQASPGSVSERRTTSVLFGDLVAFTTLSERRDPDEVRELLSAYFAVARTVVGRYGGTIEKFIGDAVMAVWGVPVAQEDDAERAVRAGMDLLDEVRALGESVGAPALAMRVGVVTGSVAVTLGAVGEGMVAGDAVNTAARVQSAAEPGTVWTDDTTRSLTAASIAYSDMGAHALKGKSEPVRLFRAVAVVAARGGAQRVDGLEAPLTGRDPEMRRIKETFHAVETDHRSHLLLIEGQAGTGKSRLGWEFEKYVDGLQTVVRWHRGRCLSYGDGVAFWAFAEMIRSRFGLTEQDDQHAVTVAVDAAARAVARDNAEAQWLIPRLAALLTGAAGYARNDLFSAWSTYLERLSLTDPLVLLFEDVQHADAGLLDLVEYLMTACRAPLFVVLLARPGLRERLPSLTGGTRVTVMTLDPLTDPDMAALLGALVRELPAAARDALVARADGVPLYAVETVRSLIDSDAVVARDGYYVFDDPHGSKIDLAALSAPVSLQTLIAARLDALTPLERRTAQDAAVLGLTFRRSGLVTLSKTAEFDLDVALLGLVRKGLVETVVDPRSPEVGAYRFLQSMVREVARSTLSRRDRRARHLAAAGHLEATTLDRDAVAAVIARHLLDALDAQSLDDPDQVDIAVRARGLLVAAAARAEALGSFEEALRAYQSALTLEAEPAETADLQRRAARAAESAGDYDVAAALAVAARDALLQLDDWVGAASASAALGMALIGMGRHSEVPDLLRPVVARLVEEEGDYEVTLDVMRPLSTALRLLGQREEGLAQSLAMMTIAERAGQPQHLVRALTGLSIALIDQGMPTVYLALLEKATDLSRRHHLPEQVARSLSNILAGVWPNDLNRGVAMAEEALETSRRAGQRQFVELAAINGCMAFWHSGAWDRLGEVSADVLSAGYGEGLTGTLSYLSLLPLVERGEPLPVRASGATDDLIEHHSREMNEMLTTVGGDPVEVARRASQSLRAAYSGDTTEDFEFFWPPVVELQLAAGDDDEAESLLRLSDRMQGTRSNLLLKAQRARLSGLVAAARGQDPEAEAELRTAEATFAAYGAPFHLARTRLERGRWLTARGRGAEAAPLLAQARDTFTALRAARSLAELESVQPRAVRG